MSHQIETSSLRRRGGNRHRAALAAAPAAFGRRAVLPAPELPGRPLRRRRHRLLRRLHRLHEPDQSPRRRRQRRQAHLGRVRDPVRGRARRRMLRAAEEPAECRGLQSARRRHRRRDDRPHLHRQDPADHHQPRPARRPRRRERLPLSLPAAPQPVQRDLGIITFIAQKEGGFENLKGKKIVVLYHGSPYGKETIPVYDLLAEKYGFEVQQHRGAAPGQRPAGPVADHPPRPARLRRASRLGRDEPRRAQDRPEGRLPVGPHHRQRLVQLGRGRDPRRRRRQGLHRASPPSPPAPTSRSSRRSSRTSTAPGVGNLEDRSASAASSTISASPTASSTSRRSAPRRRSSATGRSPARRWPGASRTSTSTRRASRRSAPPASSSRSTSPAPTMKATAPSSSSSGTARSGTWSATG